MKKSNPPSKKKQHFNHLAITEPPLQPLQVTVHTKNRSSTTLVVSNPSHHGRTGRVFEHRRPIPASGTSPTAWLGAGTEVVGTPTDRTT